MTTALRTRPKGRINTVTTMRKNKIPDGLSIKFAGKAPKPSRNNPRGTLKVAHHRENGIHMYGWMDNGAVYFMDSTQRGSEMVQIQRRVGGQYQYFQVPQAISESITNTWVVSMCSTKLELDRIILIQRVVQISGQLSFMRSCGAFLWPNRTIYTGILTRMMERYISTTLSLQI